jgi:hypothetical protein
MPNYAIIENGKVVNTVVAEPDYAASLGWIELQGDAAIDWDYINGQFIDNRPQLEIAQTPKPTKDELLAQLNLIAAQIQALD